MRIMEKIREKLSNIVSESNIIVSADMRGYTSLRAGGKAALLVEPQDVEQLRAILNVLRNAGTEYMVVGNGTNILVRDEGYNGVIVRIGKAFHSVERQGNCLICGAGALLSVIAKAAAAAGLAGFEFASGIPGSMGGAVFMNAGAYGGEIKDILKKAKVVSSDGSEVNEVTAEELEMSYRHTALHESGDIVVEAVLELAEGNGEEIRAQMDELAAKRNAKQPVQYPSAGSFFKRPEGHFAGKLIEDAGCKGLCVGGAEVSTLHSGFIINKGGATATDIIRLMDIVRACVYEQFHVMLEPEVRIIGGDGTEMRSAFIDDADVKGDDELTVDDFEMVYDLHTHTKYSHGSGTVEDNVRIAVDKKLEYIAISDHGPGHLFYGVNRNDFVNMRNDIEKMNVKFPKTNVRMSVEANTVCGGNGLDIKPEEFEEFDFIIAGFHFGLFGCGSIRNWLWSHGIRLGEKSLKARNTRMIVDSLRKNDLAILTHPGDKGPFDVAEISEACVETDTLMEINCRHGHLTVEEIKVAAQNPDAKFIISSDAHTPDAVGTFKPGLQRALDAGLDPARIVNIRRKKQGKER